MKLFISYSHKDEAFCKDLQTHLIPLKRGGLISHWTDREIKGGEDFDDTIKHNISTSDIILFLLSPDFLASDYINDTEVKLAMEQHSNGKSVVVPVMLRKCQFDLTPFKDIQGLPTDLEPISSKKWVSQDDAYFDIIEGLKKIISHQEVRKEVLEEEELLWAKAIKANTIESYFQYLERSRLRTRFEEVLKIVGKLNIEKFNQERELDALELKVRDKERQRIGMEIHDNFGQILTVIRMNISWIIRKREQQTEGTEENDKLNEILQYVNTLIIETRKLSGSLVKTENVVREFGLKEALLDLQSMLNDTGNISTNFIFSGIEEIDNLQLQTSIARIVQELSTNIVNHAQAKNVDLSLKKEEEEIVLIVSDDGVGFDGLQKSNGIGLSNIKLRVAHFGGTLDIASGKEGTKVSIVIPVPAADKQ